MRKFSEINDINEEFLNIFGKRKSSPKQEEETFIKGSKQLLESYCKNLLSEDRLKLHPGEEELYDFNTYKITSVTKIGRKRYKITMDTFNESGDIMEALSYLIEI